MLSNREVRKEFRNLLRKFEPNMGRWVCPDYPGYAIELEQGGYMKLKPISDNDYQKFEKFENRYQNEGYDTWMDISKGGQYIEDYLIGFAGSSKKSSQKFTVYSEFVKTHNGFLYCNGPNSPIISSQEKTRFIWQPLS